MEDWPGQRRDARRHLRHARGRPPRDRRGPRDGSPLGGRPDRLRRPRLRWPARRAALLDEAGCGDAQIVASGDLEERQIARAGRGGRADRRLGRRHRSRHQPRLPDRGRRLQARGRHAGARRAGAASFKRSPAKATMPGPKQVFRRREDGEMRGDVIATTTESLAGEPLLVPVMRGGERVGAEPLARMRERTAAELESLPAHLRDLAPRPAARAVSGLLLRAPRGADRAGHRRSRRRSACVVRRTIAAPLSG